MNSAGAQTNLSNTGSGPVLSLSTRPAQVPLAVSASSGKATNLNADKLDGLDSTSLALATGRVGTISAEGKLVDLDEDGLPDVVMAYAPCPTGSKVTGGGMEKYTSLPAFLSMPEDNGWLVVTEADETTAAGDAWAHAQCYNPRGAVSGASQSALRTAYTPGEDVKKRMLRALDK